jgi:hypothetical protein
MISVSNTTDPLLNDRKVTAVLVVLREYGGQKKIDPCSILQFIELQAASRYQVPAPEGALEYLLLAGRLVVIFDGLDELLDTSYRREVSDDVESFSNLYPSVPVIVTSREVGYEQAPLDPQQFNIFRIAPFSEGQVLSYASKWFARDEELTDEQKRSKARAFLNESSLVPDLRSNPLMLGLMCNLYRADGYIPRNRPEIYEKCAVMLFERWDKGRGIVVPLPFEEHIRPAMEHLAYWIYSEESLQSGVSHTRLTDETSKYLNRWVFDDLRRAQNAAADFINFCTGRAWVFSDTGTTADGERLFQFTHRTFLEYFASTYLFSVHPTPEGLGTLLRPRIAKQEWDVVALLSFQILSRRVQGGADKLLTGLLTDLPEISESERWNLLLFAARSLESIVPSPPVRKYVIRACVEMLIRRSGAGSGTIIQDGFAMISPLLSSNVDNLTTVSDTLEQCLVEAIDSNSDQEAENAYDVAYYIRTSFGLSPQSVGGELERSVSWDRTSRSVIAKTKARLQALAAKRFYVAAIAFEHGDISFDKFVSRRRAAALFRAPVSRLFRLWRCPLAASIVIRLRRADTGVAGATPDNLAAIGRFLGRSPTPWTTMGSYGHRPEYGMFLDSMLRSSTTGAVRPTEWDLTPDAAFAVFAVFAVLLETLDAPAQKNALGLMRQASLPMWQIFHQVLSLRVDHVVEANVDLSAFPEPYRRLMDNWANSRTHFVRIVGRRSSPRFGATEEQLELPPEATDLELLEDEVQFS